MGEIVKYTAQAYTAKFEPMQLSKQLRTVKTIEDALNSDANGLAFYKKQIGEDTVLAVIEMHLISLGQSVNVHEKLSKFQIQEIAAEILTLYYYMNMIEIAAVFRKAKRGEFGPIKYALNMPEVLQWFATYSEERVALFMKKSEQKSQEHKNESAVEGGKLVNQLAKKFSPKLIEALGEVKKDLPEGFDLEAYEDWKKENDH